MAEKRSGLKKLLASRNVLVFDLFHTLTTVDAKKGSGTSGILGISREAFNVQLLERTPDRVTGKEKDPYRIISNIAANLGLDPPGEIIRKAVENRTRRFADCLIHPPGATLRGLRSLREQGKRLGLLSNADTMECAGWDRSPMKPLFETAVFSCFAGCAKPDPRIFRICLENLGASPGESVFIGDGGSDELRAAREFGFKTVMVTGIIRQIWPEKIPERKPFADFMINDVSELA